MSFSEFLKGQVFVLIQWFYAIWQIARDTTFVNSVYYLCQMAINGQLYFVFRRNTNIREDDYGVPYTLLADTDKKPEVIHLSKKYSLGKSWVPSSTWEAFKARYFDNESNRNINGVKLLAFNWYWYTVEFNGSYYFCHQDILFEWAMYDIDDKMILLKEVELIANELVMGTVISKEEMFEMMLSKEYHINELYAPCIFGKQYNMPWNLRLSAFLATIPLLLQAKGLANVSALCTLTLIIVDIVRTPLLRLYEFFMSHFTKAVKLWIFRKCKNLYIFFSWFSKRWAACDRRYGYAYYTTQAKEKSVFPVTTFVKFRNLGDCEFVDVVQRAKPSIESYGFQINNGIIHSAELSYGEYCLYVKVKEGFFVSSVDALSILKYNYYSKLVPDMEWLVKMDMEWLDRILNGMCNMREILMRGLPAKILEIQIFTSKLATISRKILEIQIHKRGVATVRKILNQKREEAKVDQLLQIAGILDMKELELPNGGGESDILDEKREKLQGTQPLMDVTKDDIPDILHTFHATADNFEAFIISLLSAAGSDVLIVEVLQVERRARKPLHLVLSLFEKCGYVEATLATLFSMNSYRNRVDGEQAAVLLGYLFDVGKDAGRLSASWQFHRSQKPLVKAVAKEFGILLTTFYSRGRGSVGKGGGSTQLAILMFPETIHGSSSRVAVQGEVIEKSFGKEHLCFRMLRRFSVAASLKHGMHPPKPKWPELTDEMLLCIER